MPRQQPRVTSSRRPAHAAGGWSVIELVIAAGLVVVLLGIAIPIGYRVLGRSELAATEDNVASELLKARAEAQKSGRPVEVLLETDPSRLILQYVDPSARLSDAVGRSDRPSAARSGSTRNAKRGSAPDADWRRESAIDPSVRVERGESPRGGSAGGTTRVAVFLPDGTMLFAATLLLMHESGMQSRVSVDPYTGHPAIERRVGEDDEADEDKIDVEDEGDEPLPARRAPALERAP